MDDKLIDVSQIPVLVVDLPVFSLHVDVVLLVPPYL
jgi:hypothetical protein